MKKRKNPLLAMLLSAFVLPGAGQFYNKQYIKGAAVLFSFIVLMILTLAPVVIGYIDYLDTILNIDSIGISKVGKQLMPKPNLALGTIMTVIWIFAAVDAYIFAKKLSKEFEKQEIEAIMNTKPEKKNGDI